MRWERNWLLEGTVTHDRWTANLARNVRLRRQELRMSQESLAQQAAIDVRYLGGIEREQKNPSLDVIVRVSRALGVTPLDLLADV